VDATSAAAGGIVSAVLAFECFAFMCWGIMFLAMMAIVLASLALWIWMLVDVIRRPDSAFPDPGENTKVLWIVIVVATSWIGAIVYYFLVYRQMGPAPDSA